MKIRRSLEEEKAVRAFVVMPIFVAWSSRGSVKRGELKTAQEFGLICRRAPLPPRSSCLAVTGENASC